MKLTTEDFKDILIEYIHDADLEIKDFKSEQEFVTALRTIRLFCVRLLDSLTELEQKHGN